MNVIWNEKIDSILSIGFNLSESYINNWALDKVQAIEAINNLKILRVSILGGDVCIKNNGVFEYNHDNWYCDKNENEDDLRYACRSAEFAVQYILNYCNNNLGKFYFTLVPLVKK